MATSQEIVINRALSGAELRELIREDFDRLLANDGLLSDHIAYGRVSYDIILYKHLDNAARSEDVSRISSRRIATNIVSERPELAAVETIPLANPSSEAVVSGDRASRDITSPNQERLRTGLPVAVTVQQQDGTKTTEMIHYPRPETMDEDAGLRLSDVTREAAAALGIPATAIAPAKYAGSDPT